MRKPEGKRVSGMDSVASGLLHHSEKGTGLSLEEKRQIVHEIAQCLEDAPAVLNSFKKKELLEIICAEVGKERKFSGFTGFTKPRMIEYLLKLLSKKCNKETAKELASPSPMQDEKKFTKQQKNKYLSQLPFESNHSHGETVKEEDPKLLLCGNLACRASIDADDIFCKRCSCCICHKYDENKDPSLWLTCDYNSREEGESCRISCHLTCALDRKPSGMKKDSSGNRDDYFCCVSCGKPYGIMRTWRKQLVAATEARRVDMLCQRLSLSYKILVGSDKYKGLLKMVESAVIALENEVGPLHQASATMDRSIVNRLSCGATVQKLCASAVESFDSMMDSQCFNHVVKQESPACNIHFEASSPTKVAVSLKYEDLTFRDLLGCRIWHRRSGTDYPVKPTYNVSGPVKRFELCDLRPSTEYCCKVAFFSKTGGTLGTWEANWRTPTLLVEDEATRENANANNAHAQMRTESMSSSDSKVALSEDLSKEQSFNEFGNKGERSPTLTFPKKNVCLASPTSNAPSTPCKSDGTQGMPHLVSQRHLKETDYEYAVRVVRKLEHEGHLGSDFRVKFLTWFSLKATLQEKRVVSVFIETFSDDPLSLAEQLLDTFKDEICNEQKLASPPMFCTRLWH